MFRKNKQEIYNLKTANQKFSDDVLINSEFKSGKWRLFYVPDMICDNLKNLVEMYMNSRTTLFSH